MSKKKVAIFDIDGTIFRSSLMIELVKEFVNQGIFAKKVEKAYLDDYHEWLNRKDSYEKYLDAMIETFEKNIIGVKKSDFWRIARKIVKLHKNHVYRYTRNLVKDLKNKDYYLLAISNSPEIMVSDFCKKWGFNKVYGRLYEYDKNKKFTGKILYLENISDKSKILNIALARENLTLKNSVGVGDTESDIPFLRMVERPICFDPNKKLYYYAKKRGWKIVVERKDVIYYL